EGHRNQQRREASSRSSKKGKESLTTLVFFLFQASRGGLGKKEVAARFPSPWKGHRSGSLHCGRPPIRFPSLWKGHRSGFLHCGRPPFWFILHEIPPFRITTSSGLGI
ncbi:hypothetical protein Taro_046432, partial [Colocasia esculenta]|nr:hypothetical protein [Colocasia esculenta]